MHSDVLCPGTRVSIWMFVGWVNKTDEKLAAQTLCYQIDPLSRRSLLVHMPENSHGAFYLTSVRSSLAREQGIVFQALDGGEGGLIRLPDMVKGDGVSSASMLAAFCTDQAVP
jgi:hypothetical protein